MGLPLFDAVAETVRTGRGEAPTAWAPAPADAAARQLVIAKAIVRRQQSLFWGLRRFGRDDLLQEALIAANRAHGKFQAGRGSYDAWIGRAIRSRLIDLWRTQGKDETRIQTVREATTENDLLAEPVVNCKVLETQQVTHPNWNLVLAAELRNIAARYIRAHAKRGPRGLSRPAIMALVCLREHCRCTWRALEQAANEDAGLRGALDLEVRVDYRNLFRAARDMPIQQIRAILDAALRNVEIRDDN